MLRIDVDADTGIVSFQGKTKTSEGECSSSSSEERFIMNTFLSKFELNTNSIR